MKIKEFWTKNKTVLRGLAAGIIVAVSVAIFLVLLAFKVVYFDDGMKLNAALVESFRSSAWGIIGFILVEAVLTVVYARFGYEHDVHIACDRSFSRSRESVFLAFSGVMISSAAMYLTRQNGRVRLCEKLLGGKDCARAAELLRNKVRFISRL
ncbi:MAG: hypothetical protein ACLUSP_08540 [Christensenellales bacterium]